ncbi:uncharacterized protein LOC117113050 isoform X2 [Anneissia japonica]|uniref:uncharacterized protein LOC117113050 isoform X2 n=1 Tax=Anneissia japonica TaxID=1529436 RepID=UPI00142572AC|nr:uncharacterized protein LOC117113050 isoform X2 [Anneissia japonica]
MKWLIHYIFFLYLSVVTYVESMRNVDTNQKNVHRTHIFNMLHKTNLFSAKQMLQHERKSDHSIRSNNNYQESRVNVNNNYIFKWNEVNANRTPVNNLRKRYSNFSFVSSPYLTNFETALGAVHRVKSGEREQEFISGKKHRKYFLKRKRNAYDNAHPVFKREVPSVNSSSQDSNSTETNAGSNSETPVSSPPHPGSSLPGLKPSQALPDSSLQHSDDNVISKGTQNAVNISTKTDKEIPNNFPLEQDLNATKHVVNQTHPRTPTNTASVTLQHPVTTAARTTAPKSASQEAPSNRPMPVTAVQQQHSDMTLPLQKPTAKSVKPNVEELQERTSETECKNGQCAPLDGPISRFSDATWAVGSMTFILMLLTVSVLYTGLWKKRNHFFYGFKSREESAVSQHHFNRTNVSDMIRRLKSTKKNEMIRLKRMFGSKYNRVPLAEGSDIEEDDSSV